MVKVLEVLGIAGFAKVRRRRIVAASSVLVEVYNGEGVA